MATTLLTVPCPHPSPQTDARPFVFVPLYIYPAPGAWDPLFTAAARHATDVDFYVVVNPANGPGAAAALPDANYVAALERLAALANVKILGYVHCRYGLREAEEIVEDVRRYAAWEGASERAGRVKISVEGIFIDETPSSTEYVQYLATLANAAKTILNRNVLAPVPPLDGAAISSTLAMSEEKQQGGIKAPAPSPAAEANDDGDGEVTTRTSTTSTTTTTPPTAPPPPPRTTTPQTLLRQNASGARTPSLSSAIVIYNPGVVVDPIFYAAADYVVAFENACAAWAHPHVAQAFARLPRALVARSVPVAHSGGAGEPSASAEAVAAHAAALGCRGVFATRQPGYTAWCEGWEAFVGGVARRAQEAAAAVAGRA